MAAAAGSTGVPWRASSPRNPALGLWKGEPCRRASGSSYGLADSLTPLRKACGCGTYQWRTRFQGWQGASKRGVERSSVVTSTATWAFVPCMEQSGARRPVVQMLLLFQ